MHLFKYDARMQPILSVRFYRTTSGKEPVRDWLIEQVSLGARKAIGADIKTVQFGWPIGMLRISAHRDRPFR